MSLEPITPDDIRAFRKVAGLSQVAFAERLGISRRTVEEWEAGRNPIPSMIRFAVIGLSVDHIAPQIGEGTEIPDNLALIPAWFNKLKG